MMKCFSLPLFFFSFFFNSLLLQLLFPRNDDFLGTDAASIDTVLINYKIKIHFCFLLLRNIWVICIPYTMGWMFIDKVVWYWRRKNSLI